MHWHYPHRTVEAGEGFRFESPYRGVPLYNHSCVRRLTGTAQVFEILSTKEGHEEEEYVQNVLYGEL